jgi:hypothetical protein
MKLRIVARPYFAWFIAFIVFLPVKGQSKSGIFSDSITEVEAILTQGYPVEKSFPAGYKTDGSVDYTTYVQSALDKYTNAVFPAFPILINDKGLTLHDGQKIYFKKGSVLILAPTTQGDYQILRLHNVSHVSLYGPVIKGDKYNHLDNKGEWGMGISIRGADDIMISSARIEQCWGDGIYIGGTVERAFSSKLNLRYITCNDNRRNGISVISARNLILRNPVLTNTSGTPPMCGLDLEPNGNKDIIDSIKILNAVTENDQFGISFYLTPLNGANLQTSNITIYNHRDEGSKSAIQCGSKGNHINGRVIVENANWNDNADAIKIVNYEPNNGVQVIFKNIKITKAEDGLRQNVQDGVFSNLKRALKPQDTGIQIR